MSKANITVIEVPSEVKIDSLYRAITDVVDARVRQNKSDGQLTYAEAVGTLELVKQHYILQAWDLTDE